jgi:hypothetical protein
MGVMTVKISAKLKRVIHTSSVRLWEGIPQEQPIERFFVKKTGCLGSLSLIYQIRERLSLSSTVRFITAWSCGTGNFCSTFKIACLCNGGRVIWYLWGSISKVRSVNALSKIGKRISIAYIEAEYFFYISFHASSYFFLFIQYVFGKCP